MKSKQKINMAEMAMQRSNVYGLLALIYAKEPTSAFLNQIKDFQLLEQFSELGIQFDEKFFCQPNEKLLELLAVEYANLFIGPGRHISPHESVHLKDDGEGLLWGKSTVKVKKFIESSGLVYNSGYRGMPDHISVEMEFMQKLTDCEAESWKNEDIDGSLFCLNLEQKFLEGHIVRWVPFFCDQVIKNAKLSFYKEMARLTKNLVEYEREEIKAFIDEIEDSRQASNQPSSS